MGPAGRTPFPSLPSTKPADSTTTCRPTIALVPMASCRRDLFSNDPCFGNTQPDTVCDFSYSGYRVPLVVVSPFAKANGVSHQQRDLTAILKLIEKRFGLNALTARDAAQVDMDDTTDGFFDFTNAPLKTPPSLPAQTVLGPTQCYLDHLPCYRSDWGFDFPGTAAGFSC